MRFIEKRVAGKDQDVQVPLFMLNHAELRTLQALLAKAKVYLPSALVPEMGRIRGMAQCIEQYFGPKFSKKHPRSRNSGMEESK